VNFVKLELPYKIKPKEVRIFPRTFQGGGAGNAQSPAQFKIFGSNDNFSSEIVELYHQNTDWVNNGTWGVFDISHTTHFKHFGIVFTKTNGSTVVGVQEIEYYGHEEGSASLDTTLKSVYNVPATTGTQLEVYYDAKDLTTMPATVSDLAGGDQNGTPGTGVSFDSTYKAFVFDGSANGKITGDSNSLAGNWIHTMSTWIYFNSLVNGAVLGVKPTSYNFSGHNEVSVFYARPTGFIWDFGNANNNTTSLTPLTNKWYHIALVADGTGIKKMYIDNQLQSSFSYSNTTNIVMQTNSPLDIGKGNLDGKNK